MPYVPPEVKERIKREVSIQRLAEARGIQLRRVGRNLMGLCPFHKDTRPSLSIDVVKNEWHCFGCDRKGDVIEWARCAEGVSFTHALELLRRDYLPTATTSASPPPKNSTVPKLPPLFEPTVDDQKLLGIVVDYYHRTLKQSPGAQQYLVKRGLQSTEMVEHFKLGFSNRSLNYHLQDKNRALGLNQRGRLEELGILREKSGHEHFVGSLVIPILNLNGEVVQMYGRKINDRLRPGTEYHLYLPGPRCGVWNEQALIASKDIILCEALIDALTFWCAGYRNVTTSYGVNGFNDSHREAFQKHGTKRIYIAYDRDEAGEKAAAKHAEELMQMGIECFRVQFPRGQDANEFARKQQPAAKWLGMSLTSAAWLGKGQRPTVAVMTPASPASPEEGKPEPMKKQEPSPTEEKPKSTAKEKRAIESPTPSPTSSTAAESVFPLAAPLESVQREQPAQEQRPMPLSAPTAPQIKIDNGEIVASFGARTYRVLNLEKCTSLGRMQVNVKVSGTNVRGEWCYHGDTFDMESFPRRAAFIKQTAHELAAKEETIQREVGQLWGALGDMQREMLRNTLTPEAEETIMTAEEKAAAMELLRDPRLLKRVLEDFEKCGVVGEETNKKVSYLAAVSRLLEKPLAIVVQSASSAGKSSLMEAVLDFMPEEQRESYSAMTGQALFYMGQKNLKHKILAVSEEEGAQRAAYALKLLQSEGKLKIASTGKDPVSGKQVTHEYTVEGPVMIFLTTTAQQVDEELLNRSIVLTVNEEREQTRAIHRKQREARTTEGLWAWRERARIVKLHRNAQRLLRPIAVANNQPDADEDFPDHMTRTRRDHAKLLTLIDSIALLHQHQREIKRDSREGDTLEYIEATAEDVALAKQLMRQVIMPSLDELPPHTRRLLGVIEQMVKEECERLQIESSDYRFTRRSVRQYSRWGDTQLRVHLRRLEEMEYLRVRYGGPGQTFVYQLHSEEEEANRNHAGSRGVRGDRAGVGESELSPVKTRVQTPTARFAGSILRGNGADPGQIVVVAKANGAEKPNGHGLAKHAAVR
ncbi:MAG: CHC2 zinc finger domain-containing protein [Candidatus Sulfotelmatobacter sp.]